MRTSDQGLFVIARFEGIVPAPYLDVLRVWTFGLGHTAAAGAPDPAKMPRGMPDDLDAAIRDAFALFRRDIAKYEREVLAAVHVALAQHEFDALVSWHYNTGAVATATLTKRLNAGDRSGAGQQFTVWNKAGGKVNAGLKARRADERHLFSHGIYPSGSIPVWSADANGRVRHGKPVRIITEDEARAIIRRPVEPLVPVPAPNATPTQPAPVGGWFAALWQRLRQLFTRKDTP